MEKPMKGKKKTLVFRGLSEAGLEKMSFFFPLERGMSERDCQTRRFEYSKCGDKREIHCKGQWILGCVSFVLVMWFGF